MSYDLPEGYELRPPIEDDLSGVFELIAACDMAAIGKVDITKEDIAQDWKRPGFSLAEDAWVVLDKESKIAGYEELYNRRDYVRLSGDGYVHPQYRNQGIGTTLMRQLAERAREWFQLAPPGEGILLRNGVFASDHSGRELHENEGYHPVRHFWSMAIDMNAAPAEPSWPTGLLTRSIRIGKDERQIYDALEEAFQDHWGDSPWTFETWRRRRIESDAFDPKLWLVALDGAEIAGVVIGRHKQNSGWVSQLAVRRPWRKRGLGKALLAWSLGNFYALGVRSVGLGVDAENPTGATRLYEHAGMHVEHEVIVYQKVLREGSGISLE